MITDDRILKLLNATKAKGRVLSTPPIAISNSLQQLKKIYGQTISHDFLLQCMYTVKIENVFGLQGDIPWFTNQTLAYLITDTELSFGSAEAETFYAGALPAAYLTQKTDDEMDMTFIETMNGDIFKSYRACHKRAFNDDGTVNEPRDYAFKLSIGLFSEKQLTAVAPVSRSWIVGVKSGRTELSSVGRSDVVKATITFQKLRPSMFIR